MHMEQRLHFSQWWQRQHDQCSQKIIWMTKNSLSGKLHQIDSTKDVELWFTLMNMLNIKNKVAKI